MASVPVTEGIYRCGYTKTACAGTILSNDIVTVISTCKYFLFETF